MFIKNKLLMIMKNVYILGFLIRLGFIIYGEIQESLTGINYSDLDYKVYTDGAKYVSLL